MPDSTLAVGVIRKEGSRFCLLFSNGRKECFPSKEAAEKRERQVQFFKSQADVEEFEKYGVIASYTFHDESEESTLFIIDEGDKEVSFFLTTADSVIKLEDEELSELGQFVDYVSLIDSVTEDINDEEADAGDTYRNRHWSNVPGGHNKNKFKKLKKKCSKCGKTGGMLDIHHKSGSRKDLKTGKGLTVLCRRCHRKLHQGSPATKSEASIEDKQLITIECESVSVLNADEIDNDSFAAAGFEKQKDLLYIRFVLAREGTNKNQDTFTREELKAAEESPKFKQINWEHGEPAIGTIYRAEYQEIPIPAQANFASADGKRAQIVCEGVVWKYKYPQYAKTMINRHSQGALAFSMETYFAKAKCSECGQEFITKDHGEGSYCDHLNYRLTAKASDESRASRILIDNTFGGAGVVENPAEVGSKSLALAENQTRGEDTIVSDKTFTQEDLDAAAKAAIDTYKAEHDSKEELDQAKANAEKFEGELAEARKTLESITSERDKAVKDLDDFKAEIAAKEVLQSRLSALAEAGYEVPEQGTPEYDVLKETVTGYSDTGFEFFKDALAARKPPMKKKDEDEEEEDEKKKGKKMAKASTKLPRGTAKGSNEDEPHTPLTAVCSLLEKVE